MKRLRWLGFLAGVALLFWILRGSDLPAVWQQIRGLQWRFGLIFLFYIVIFGLDTLGWRFVLHSTAHSNVRWDRLFRARLAGEAVNYVTPTAWIGGEPVKAYLLSKRYGVPMANGMASVVVAKTTFSVSMFLFILMGIGVTLFTQRVDPSVFRWVWVILPILGVLLGLFLLVQFLSPFQRIAGWVKGGLKEWDEALVRSYRKSPRAVLMSLGFHFLGWMAGVVEVFLILRFLHIPVSWATAWSLEALWILLKTGAFLIPGSLGASEGFLLLVCAGLGISAVSGLALGLVRRAREVLWVGLGLAEFSRG
ncbi:MAG: flippase-like domain-containing protein [Candidatus Omnitrophica bacterium]|nr:flippase-like domain-containing protein [Candidatus Omnitrophota bacterium]